MIDSLSFRMSQVGDTLRTMSEATRFKIIESAKKLFFEKTISAVTISDIAKEAKIGEATVYRYFGKKLTLVLESAISLSNDIIKRNLKEIDGSGYDMMKEFYYIFVRAYEDDYRNYKFINDFDAYIVLENDSDAKDYEDVLDIYKEFFFRAYEKGLSDGTIKKLDNPDMYYYSTTVSLLGLGKKVSSSKIVSSDSIFDGKEIILTMTNLIINDLKA